MATNPFTTERSSLCNSEADPSQELWVTLGSPARAQAGAEALNFYYGAQEIADLGVVCQAGDDEAQRVEQLPTAGIVEHLTAGNDHDRKVFERDAELREEGLGFRCLLGIEPA